MDAPHNTWATASARRKGSASKSALAGFFRKRLGIRIGDEVVLQLEDDELRIITLKCNIERAQRLVRKHVKPGSSLVDELIAERREAGRNE